MACSSDNDILDDMNNASEPIDKNEFIGGLTISPMSLNADSDTSLNDESTPTTAEGNISEYVVLVFNGTEPVVYKESDGTSPLYVGKFNAFSILDIYVIANSKSNIISKSLKEVTTQNELQAVYANLTQEASKLIKVGHVTHTMIPGDDAVEVPLTQLPACIKLASLEVSKEGNNPYSFKITSVKLKNAQNKTYLIENSNGYADSFSNDVCYEENDFTAILPGHKGEYNINLYAFENYSAETSTYLVIDAELYNGDVFYESRCYEILISGSDGSSLRRGHKYIISAIFKTPFQANLNYGIVDMEPININIPAFE